MYAYMHIHKCLHIHTAIYIYIYMHACHGCVCTHCKWYCQTTRSLDKSLFQGSRLNISNEGNHLKCGKNLRRLCLSRNACSASWRLGFNGKFSFVVVVMKLTLQFVDFQLSQTYPSTDTQAVLGDPRCCGGMSHAKTQVKFHRDLIC